MESTDDFDDVPFENEECGDTMWDETVLDQLTSPVAQIPIKETEQRIVYPTPNPSPSGRGGELLNSETAPLPDGEGLG